MHILFQSDRTSKRVVAKKNVVHLYVQMKTKPNRLEKHLSPFEMWKRQINVKQTFVHLSTSVTFPTLVFKSIKGICCLCKKKPKTKWTKNEKEIGMKSKTTKWIKKHLKRTQMVESCAFRQIENCQVSLNIWTFFLWIRLLYTVCV